MPCNASSPDCLSQQQETPAFSLGCDVFSQRIVLIFFYTFFNGRGWIISSGWPSMQDMSPPAIVMYMATVPLVTGVCTSTSSQDAQSRDAPAVTLPDHCCWYGIRCCTPYTCGNNPFCNCTTGLVTAIILNGNGVRGSEEFGGSTMQ